MKIFLTGSTGFIGCHLLRRLLADGHEVTTDMKMFDWQPYDLVIHLAAKTHINPEFDPELFKANILLAEKVMRSPHHLVYASSCSAAYMTNPYAYTKRFNEYLASIRKNAIGLRFHNVYGPANNKGLIKFLLAQKDKSNVTIRGPQLVRDYIHVDDVVAMIAGHIEGFVQGEHVSSIVDVGTGVGWKTIDVVNLFQEISGKRFVLNFTEHGINEPGAMISNHKHEGLITLPDGIKKLINES